MDSRENIILVEVPIASKDEIVLEIGTEEILDVYKHKLITPTEQKKYSRDYTGMSCCECRRKCSSKNHSGTRYLCNFCCETKNFCDGCKRIKKRSHLTNGNCKKCRRLTDKYSRTCYHCRVIKIGPEEPDEMDMCSKCYINECTRQCSVCKKKTIYPNAPSFVSVCFNCQNTGSNNKSKFVAKKRNEVEGSVNKGGSELLPKCTMSGCNTLVEEAWQKKCTSCYSKSMGGSNYSSYKKPK